MDETRTVLEMETTARLQAEVVKLLFENRQLRAEVKRLEKFSQDNDQAYSDGQSSGHADIVGIILDAEDEFDAMIQIKHFLGWEED